MTAAHYVDLIILGIAVASTGVLGFLVYFNNPLSATNRTYLGFSLVSIAWGVCNYLSIQVESPSLSLWMWRVVIFIAVWFCFGIFHLATIFPQSKPIYGRQYLFFTLPAVTVVSILTLTPLVFNHLRTLPIPGTIPAIETGPLISLFGVTVVLLVLGAIGKFVHRLRHSEGDIQNQSGLITVGTGITFALLIVCNFVLPVGFKMVTLIPFGAVFILPFIVCTAYAIVRYKLFNAQVVVTEIFAFLMVIATLLQIPFSSSRSELLLRVGIFVLVLVFDILLVKRTTNEVRQRELIEKQEKELEGMNTRLRDLDQQKNEFLSFASHQLRTPLTAIKWSAGAMLDGMFGEMRPELAEPVRTIFEESSLMAVFINDYLNVSRIEQGRMEYRYVPTNLVEVLKTTASQMGPAVHEKGLTLVVTPSVDTCMVWGDASKLTQVISNLIDNSVKYTEKGTITISLVPHAVEGIVRIEIKDTGIGMDRKTLSKVFDKFARGENAREVNSAGSGLGLFIVKTFVDAHKGKIWIESEGLGKGSMFVIEFPLFVS